MPATTFEEFLEEIKHHTQPQINITKNQFELPYQERQDDEDEISVYNCLERVKKICEAIQKNLQIVHVNFPNIDYQQDCTDHNAEIMAKAILRMVDTNTSILSVQFRYSLIGYKQHEDMLNIYGDENGALHVNHRHFETNYNALRTLFSAPASNVWLTDTEHAVETCEAIRDKLITRRFISNDASPTHYNLAVVPVMGSEAYVKQESERLEQQYLRQIEEAKNNGSSDDELTYAIDIENSRPLKRLKPS